MSLPFRRLLVANRGEIALRILRTARVLGLETVAVYSEADAHAPHVREADRAVLLGPPEAKHSYLDVARVVDAARASGADVVHPGYGFLSENAALPRALEEAGIVFVGPSARVLEESSDKIVVKRRVAAAGVPVVPGPLDAVGEGAAARRAAAKATGFPLLVKAASGGGGKGMRRVLHADALEEAAAAAAREAAGAFGRGELYFERIIAPARHVEVQILADRHGGVVALGERDCSLQRRHQKVIEECPAPNLSSTTRAALHEAGRRAARALDYEGAGTVEFLLAPDGAVYFLEVNRRLQVEHPVTEVCFGIDLVAWQLRIAAGEKLPAESHFAQRGHAIEARVYAEDPANGFLPASGRVLRVRLPSGPGLRIDGMLEDGLEISAFYDPLLAKVVAHGETRDEARRRLDRALGDVVLIGLRHNVAFLRRLLVDRLFTDPSLLSIAALDEHAERLSRDEPAPDWVVLAATAAAASVARPVSSGAEVPSDGPWERLVGFRLGRGS